MPILLMAITLVSGFCCLAHAEENPGTELVLDPSFRRGFHVLDPAPGKKVRTGVLQPPRAGAEPSWELAQWHSRFTILGAEPVAGPEGSVLFRNRGKSIIFGEPETSLADLSLGVNAVAEYGDHLRVPPEPWPHLLVSQELDGMPRLVDCSRLLFRLEVKLLKCEPGPHEGIVRNRHAAQFVGFITVQNRNRAAQGYGDFLWFGIPVYDNRMEFAKPFMAPDQAHRKFIYTPGGEAYMDRSVHTGEWTTLAADLVPLIRRGLEEAWSRGHLPTSRNIEDFRLTGFSLGWEAPGPYEAAIQIRNLSIKAYAVAPEL
ncbi:MAG: hypothetical protein KBI47_00425 [Armatimonadetes bacterium]|nr:hypothetical protein [Armatimonadota bacterium]MDI9582686.1 hypothetical protein [Acidobacteriota bacterium]